METMIEVRQLCKSFVINKKQNHVLRNVDLSIHKGEFIAVMGPSGSGKSTLLYTISGMDHINSGTVEFDHKEISRYNEMEMAKLRLHEMGFIFQQMHFLNNLNIYDNVILRQPRASESRTCDTFIKEKPATGLIQIHTITQVIVGLMHFFHNFFLFPSGFTAKILNALFLTVTDIHTDSQAHQACDNTLVHSITPITDSMDTVLSVIPSFLLFFPAVYSYAHGGPPRAAHAGTPPYHRAAPDFALLW